MVVNVHQIFGVRVTAAPNSTQTTTLNMCLNANFLTAKRLDNITQITFHKWQECIKQRHYKFKCSQIWQVNVFRCRTTRCAVTRTCQLWIVITNTCKFVDTTLTKYRWNLALDPKQQGLKQTHSRFGTFSAFNKIKKSFVACRSQRTDRSWKDMVLMSSSKSLQALIMRKRHKHYIIEL